MKVAFLFGAGTSNAVGMPKTQDITEKILSGNGFIRHTDGNYYFQQRLSSSSDPYIIKITPYISLLHNEAKRYYHSRDSINYEDICYLAAQMRDSETREFDNPAVQLLIDKIVVG